MKRTELREISENINSFGHVTVCGWVRSLRASGSFAFIDLYDGSSFSGAQIVLLRERLADFDALVHIGVGTAVSVSGEVIATPEAPQPFEIRAEEMAVQGVSTPDYPLQKKRHSVEYLRTIPHLRPRTRLFSAVFRIRSEAAFAIHEFFHSRGFLYVHTPIITPGDCEGAGEMFRVTAPGDCERDFFGQPVNLTVSGQLEGESLAMAYGKIYTFGPTFRAENSNTARHAAEFWMIEPEIAFADLDDDIELAWDMLQSVVARITERCAAELDFLCRYVDTGLTERLEKLRNSKYRRITYTEAVEILQTSGESFKYPVSWGADLQTEHERYLCERHFNSPVFVTGYPKEIKAFYMRMSDDGKTVDAVDLLVPGVGEIIGGSQREERIDVLEMRMKECGLNEDDYVRYLDLRRWGGAKHAGFGLGFERLIMYLTGVTNIRDVIPYPRTAGSII